MLTLRRNNFIQSLSLAVHGYAVPHPPPTHTPHTYSTHTHPHTHTQQYSKIQMEVEILRSLRHRNIVSYLGTSLQEGLVFIFMDYISGGSLHSILKRWAHVQANAVLCAAYTVCTHTHTHTTYGVHFSQTSNQISSHCMIPCTLTLQVWSTGLPYHLSLHSADNQSPRLPSL